MGLGALQGVLKACGQPVKELFKCRRMIHLWGMKHGDDLWAIARGILGVYPYNPAPRNCQWRFLQVISSIVCRRN